MIIKCCSSEDDQASATAKNKMNTLGEGRSHAHVKEKRLYLYEYVQIV